MDAKINEESANTQQPKVALYLRVSTNDQHVETQEHDLRRLCACRGWNIVKVFKDVGVSGAKDSRPGLDDMMKEMRKGKFDIVAVYRFDRFARSTQHLLSALQEFKQYGVDFISSSEGIDTSTNIGKLIYTLIAGISEFEKTLINERVVAGLARAKSEGVKLGRPHRGFNVVEALQLKQAGESWKTLSKKISVPVATLRRTLTPLLKNPESAAA